MSGVPLRRMAAGFAVWLVVCAGLWLLGERPHPGLLALAVLAVGASLSLLLDADSATPGVRWQLPAPDPAPGTGREPRLDGLTRSVRSHLVARQPDQRLPELLLALADRRLVHRYGVSRRADPERADRLLGPELAALTHPDRAARLSPARIARLIDRIEEL